MRSFNKRLSATLILLAFCGHSLAEGPLVTDGGLAVKPAKPLKYLRPDAVNFVALLPPPPASGSLEEQSELREIKAWQTLRSKTDEARSKDEETLVVFKAFAPVLGEKFTADRCPKTAKLFDVVTVDSKHFSAAAKNHWARRRPPYLDTSLVPAAKLEDEPAYPSGHATRGELFAELLAEVVPDRRDALLARGQEIGFDRVIAAVHYPSDVAAGRMLGHVLVQAFLAEPTFRSDFAQVQAEIQAALAQ